MTEEKLKGDYKRKKTVRVVKLVVVAIIMIIILFLFSYNISESSKTYDGRIKASLLQITTEAEIYYDENGNFDGVCDDTNVRKLAEDIKDCNGEFTCNDNSNSFAAESTLNNYDGYFCVDSTDQSYTTKDSIGDATVCPEEVHINTKQREKNLKYITVSIFFISIIGLALMWILAPWSKKAKWIITNVIIVIVTIVLILLLILLSLATARV